MNTMEALQDLATKTAAVAPGTRAEIIAANAAELQSETYGIDDFGKRPKATWLVPKLIPSHGVGVIWGASGTYKTFFVLDLVLRLCAGTPVWGRTSKQTPCAYLYGEGGSGIDKRIDAWLIRHQVRPAIHLLPRTPPLAEQYTTWAESIAEWAIALGVRCLVIDTTARAFGGASENDAQDMGRFVESLSIIQRAVGLVIVIHHAGVEGSRMRGSTALYAAADFVFAVKRVSDRQITATNAQSKSGKTKDAEELDRPIALRLIPVDLGEFWLDDDEQHPQSLVIEHEPEGFAEGEIDEQTIVQRNRRALRDAEDLREIMVAAQPRADRSKGGFSSQEDARHRLACGASRAIRLLSLAEKAGALVAIPPTEKSKSTSYILTAIEGSPYGVRA